MKVRTLIMLILGAGLMRLLPHPPNFTPIAAIGIFGAAHFNKKWMAFLMPFAALFVSDLILNNVVYAEFYEGFVWITSIWTYLAFGAVVGLGFLFNKEVSAKSVLTSSVAAALVFFLVSNFGSWMIGIPAYPKTIAGLIACYTAGLPFLLNTMAGTVLFSGALFGGFELLKSYYPAMKMA